MATTQKGIYYPDDYRAVADVPEDMKDLAESVDTALDTKVDKEEGKGLSTYNFGVVSKTRLDSLWRDKPIVESDIERIKATLPTTTGSGENITLDKTAEMEFIQPPLPRGNSKQATAILPTGYTQLDYIESTGTQYINTGITPDVTLEFDITFNTSNNLSMSNYGCIFGSRVGSGNKDIQLTTYSEFGYSGTIRWGNTYGINAYLSNNTKINVKLENNKYYVDNEEKQSITINDSNNYNIFIFALNAGGTVSQYGKLKLYKFKLWKNGSLVRNFIPCKNASNEVGLYDLVSETFFGNSGTGTFTAGDVATLPNPDFEVPIQNVTGDVEVLVQNKNLFDYEFISDYSNITSSTLKFVEVKGLKPNTTYFISNYDTSKANQVNVYSMGYEPNTAHGQQIMLKNSSWYYPNGKSFTTTETGKWYIGLYNPTTQEAFEEAIKVFENAQIEENTTATTYTPHQEQTFTFPLGTQRMYLGDYLADDGIHHPSRNQIILDGSEDEIYDIELKTGYSILKITIDDMVTINNGIGLSSHFTRYSYHNAVIGAISFGWINKVVYMYMPDTITSVADFRTWLSAHNVTLEYLLATEEITPYTTEQQAVYDEIKQALSYEEQTNISGTSDEANPIFSVEAYQSIKLILAS